MKKILTTAFMVSSLTAGNAFESFANNTRSSLSKSFETAKISGRLHIDSKFYDENETLGDTKQDGVDIKRARLGIKGKISDNFSYKFENDFVNNVSKIKDAYISYDAIKNSKFKIGQFKQAFGLVELISSNNITFINRSVAIGDAPSRTFGAQGSKYGKNWQVAAGIFGESVGNEGRDDDSESSLALRASYAPINSDGNLVHLGLAANIASKDRNTLSASNTADNPIDKQSLYGAELALSLGSLLFQGEYAINNTIYDKDPIATDATNGKEATFNSYYIQASYILTGENRIYKAKSGTFKGVKVKNSVDNGGIGAWELAARISQDDKNANDGATAITNGKTDEMTFGINWYLNNNTRIMANYITSEVDNRTNSNQGYDAFILRTQFNF